MIFVVVFFISSVVIYLLTRYFKGVFIITYFGGKYRISEFTLEIHIIHWSIKDSEKFYNTGSWLILFDLIDLNLGITNKLMLPKSLLSQTFILHRDNISVLTIHISVLGPVNPNPQLRKYHGPAPLMLKDVIVNFLSRDS